MEVFASRILHLRSAATLHESDIEEFRKGLWFCILPAFLSV